MHINGANLIRIVRDMLLRAFFGDIIPKIPNFHSLGTWNPSTCPN